MNIYLSGSMAHLEGDWTHAGVTESSIELLTDALQQIEPGVAKGFQIDCRNVRAIDITGLQLLYVWMQCVKLRGVEPDLVNPSNNLQQAFRSVGQSYHVRSLNFAGRNHATTKYGKRSLHGHHKKTVTSL